MYILLVVFFVVYSCFDFKKSFLTYAAFSILLNAGIAFKYSSPAITCEFILSLYFSILFWCKYKNKYIRRQSGCLLKRPFLFCSISLIISSFITFYTIDSISGFSNSIQKIITNYLFICCFWYICRTINDIMFFSKRLLLVFVVVFVYGVFEYISNSNPVLEYIKESIPDVFAKDKIYLSDLDNLRDGRARFQSLFSISILYGIMSVLFCFFLIYIKQLNVFRINKWVYYSLILCSLFACYLSNSKTPVVAISIFLIPIILNNRFLLFVDCFLIVFIICFPDIILNVLSYFINIDAFKVKENSLEGSSLYMRMIQLDTSISLFLKSPIWGNGIRSAAIFSEKGYQVFGAESVWFRLMIEQGLLGLISYIYMMISLVKISLKQNRLKIPLLFYTFGFFTICSITDINYTMFFMCFIVMYKLEFFLK